MNANPRVRPIAAALGIALALASAPIAAAQSAAELLEKAIYTEETVGDVDRAVDLYRRAIEVGESSRRTAAHAHLRLGAALLRQGRRAEATAEFERLIEMYPEQEALVERARMSMPPKLAISAPVWRDGEETVMRLRLRAGLVIGQLTLRADATTESGRAAWRYSMRRYTLANMPLSQGYSEVVADAQTGSPIRSDFVHTALGEVSTRYEAGGVRVTRPDESHFVELDETHYENDQTYFIVRRLPLEPGYTAELPVFAAFGAGAIPLTLTVGEIETVSTPAGEFECYPVELKPVNQVIYFTADAARRPVRLEAEGLIGELIRYSEGGERPARPFESAEWPLAFELPDGWDWMRFEGVSPGELHLFLIPPRALALIHVSLERHDGEDVAGTDAARERAERSFEEAQRELENLALRDDGWGRMTVAGREAVTVAVDFEVRGEPWSMFGVFAYHEQTALRVLVQCERSDLDRLRETVRGIIGTIEWTR